MAASAALALAPSQSQAAKLEIDRGFGNSGFADLSPIARITDLDRTADGALLVIGWSDGRAVAARYDANGALDSSFGQSGVADLGTAEATSLAPAADGGFLVVADGGILRFDASGAPDLGFGQAGRAEIGRSVRLVSVSPDGRIFAAGATFTNFQTCGPRPFGLPWVARLNADGTLDEAFGEGGFWGRVVQCSDGFNSTVLFEDLGFGPDSAPVLIYLRRCYNCAHTTSYAAFVSADGSDAQTVQVASNNYYLEPASGVTPDGTAVLAGENFPRDLGGWSSTSWVTADGQVTTSETEPEDEIVPESLALSPEGAATVVARKGDRPVFLTYPRGPGSTARTTFGSSDLSEELDGLSAVHAEWFPGGTVIAAKNFETGETKLTRVITSDPLRLDILKLKVPRTLNGVLGRGIYAKVKSNAEAVVKTEATVSRRTANRLGLRTRTIATGSGPVAPPRADQVPVFLTERAGDRLAANPGMKIRFRVTVRAKGADASKFDQLSTGSG